MNKIIKIIINNHFLHQIVIKIYLFMTAPYILLSSFVRNTKIITTPNIEKLKTFQDKHMGERCFIIGNGPSLDANDLDKLKNEVTFAFNSVYLIFKKTEWRPTYYMLADQNCYMNIGEEINTSIRSYKFIGANCKKYGRIIKDATYFYTKLSLNSDNPKFSDNALKYFYDGYTISYFAIQMAVYMGFKEIILLGMDCRYKKEVGEKGEIIENDQERNYFSEKYQKDKKMVNTYKMISAYKSAEKYANNNGIMIYNATRGGNLDVFDRIEFDEISLENSRKSIMYG